MPLSQQFETLVLSKAKRNQALQIAKRASQIGATLHRTAPRDSTGRNSRGLFRSKTLAAPDTFHLLREMTKEPVQLPDGWRVTLNYDVLERGPLKRQLRELTREQLERELSK